MLTGALRLQSLKFVHVSEEGSSRRSFVPPQVLEWLWRGFQNAHDVERRVVELSPLVRKPLLGSVMSLAVTRGDPFLFNAVSTRSFSVDS